jgi:hypothetical protein
MFGVKLSLPRRFSPKTAVTVASQTDPSPKSSAPRISPIASAVVLAAGAGAAFWWWTQWARGRAEAEADLDAAGADAEAPKDTE